MSPEALQLLRLLCLGALTAACINGLRVLSIRREDLSLRLLVAWAATSALIVLGRIVLHTPDAADLAGWMVRLGYGLVPLVAAATALWISPMSRAGSLAWLGGPAILFGALWFDGLVFSDAVVVRATAQDRYLMLAPGAGFYAFVALAALSTLASVWRCARAIVDASWRRLLAFAALLQLCSWLHDALLDAGLLAGSLTAGWVAAAMLVVVAVWVARRMLRAHSRSVEELRGETRALERQQQELAVAEQLSALGALVRGISHEINNPLATVMANLEWGAAEMRDGRIEIAPDRQAHWIGTVDRLRADTQRVNQAMRSFSAGTLRAPEREDEDRISSSGGKPRLLLVDDDERVRRALRRLLRGYHVTDVADGASAVVAIEAGDFDVVLCDVMMPEMSGIEVYERASELRPALRDRFVFLTGGTFSDSDQAALVLTKQPVLKKPVEPEELLRVLDERRAATDRQREQTHVMRPA